MRDDEAFPGRLFANIRMTILHEESTLSVAAQDVAVDAIGTPTDAEGVRPADAIQRLKQNVERHQSYRCIYGIADRNESCPPRVGGQLCRQEPNRMV